VCSEKPSRGDSAVAFASVANRPSLRTCRGGAA
jgi:hypothetical protein